MQYRIQVSSEEAKDFGLLLQIEATATFLQLHNLIIETCEYDATQMASFFTVNEKGQRLQEISLVELSSAGVELDVAVMDVATLREFVGKFIQRMEYQYDFFGDRYFSLAIETVQEGAQKEPFVLRKKGMPPPQIALDGFEGLDFSEEPKKEEMDYEKYLSSFEDCRENDSTNQSIENWEDDNFE